MSPVDGAKPTLTIIDEVHRQSEDQLDEMRRQNTILESQLDAAKAMNAGLLSPNEAREKLGLKPVVLPPGMKFESVESPLQPVIKPGDVLKAVDAKVSVDGQELQNVIGVDLAFDASGFKETLVMCSRKVGRAAKTAKLAETLGIKVISRDEAPDDAVYVMDTSKLWKPDKPAPAWPQGILHTTTADSPATDVAANLRAAARMFRQAGIGAHRASAMMHMTFSGGDYWAHEYRPSIEKARAAEWLCYYLRDGMRRVRTVLRAAHQAAIPDGALHGAKREIGIVESNGYWLLPAGLREELA